MVRKSLASALILHTLVCATEWRAWSWPGEARMGVLSGTTAWFATSGGVAKWPLGSSEATLYQTSDGLGELDQVSILLGSDGTIWSASSGGTLNRLTSGGKTWTSYDTYASSDWTFTPRTAWLHSGSEKGDLILLGGAKGLSFFSADDEIALDNVTRFGGLGQRAVYSIAVEDDTVWVGLVGGIAKAVVDWDHVGEAGYYLSDPTRWSVVDTSTGDTIRSLLPTTTGLQWSSSATQLAADWSVWPTSHVVRDTAADSTITSSTASAQVFWNGVSYTSGPNGYPSNPYDASFHPSHAISGSGGLLVSDQGSSESPWQGKGPLLLKADGSFVHPDFPGALASTPPLQAAFRADGSFVAWSAPRLYSGSRSGDWSAILASDLALTEDTRYQRSLVEDSRGDLWIGTWGNSLLRGRESNGAWSWTQYTSGNSCIPPTAGTFYAIHTVSADPQGIWATQYYEDNDTAVLVRYTAADSAMRCFNVNVSSSKIKLQSVLADGSNLWLAGNLGLIQVDTAKLVSGSSVSPTRIFGQTTSWIFRRVVKTTFEGEDWIVAGGSSGFLIVPARPGEDGLPDTAVTLLASDLGLTENLQTMETDTAGNLWIGTSAGIDIFEMDLDDNGEPILSSLGSIRSRDGMTGDDVRDIQIDRATGKALIATTSALNLWESPFRPVATRLSSSRAKVWPNPLRTRQHTVLTIDGATSSASFFLHAQDGTLVAYLPASAQVNGRFTWTIPSPRHLRPGVYRWSLKDGSKTVGGNLLVAE